MIFLLQRINVWMFLHLVAGCGVWDGLQSWRWLTDEDVAFTCDGPDGLFGRRTLNSSGVTAGHTYQRQLEKERTRNEKGLFFSSQDRQEGTLPSIHTQSCISSSVAAASLIGHLCLVRSGV